MSSETKKRKIFDKLPFEVVDPKENEIPKVNLYSKGFVFVGPKRYVQNASYKEHGLEIYNFEARPDDVYLVGFMRSGTTLHSEMVWQIGNDLNYEEAKKNYLIYRFPYIDSSVFPRSEEKIEVPKNANNEVMEIAQKYQQLSLKDLAERKGRRFLRAHLPLSLMNPQIFEVGAKVIYCARNPKDVLVSLYHAMDFFKFKKSTEDFKDLFDDAKNSIEWNGPYFEHVKEAWERRNDKNVLFLFYEDTVKDKRRTIQRVADFLGKNLTRDQIDSLENYLNFENFKKNKSVNNDQMIKLGIAEDNGKFIRQGKTGGWRDVFDEALNKEFDELMEERSKGTDLRFPET